MSATEQTLRLLTEIRDSIREGNALLRQLVAGGGATGVGGDIASDRELDSQYGNPEVRMRVRDWTGPDMKRKKFSQCPAEFLDKLAETLDWAAGKDEKSDDPDKKKYAKYKRIDARRARGWAKRIREGKVQQAPESSSSSDDGWGEDSSYGRQQDSGYGSDW